MIRFELALLALFSAVWLLAALGLFGLLPLAGSLPLDLHRFYSIAAVLGWLAGNLYVLRRRSLGENFRRRLLLTYVLGPPGVVYLLRALAPATQQAAAPLVPAYAFLVYGIFFLVPVTLRFKAPSRRS